MDWIIGPIGLQDKNRRAPIGIGILLNNDRAGNTGKNVVEKNAVGGELPKAVQAGLHLATADQLRDTVSDGHDIRVARIIPPPPSAP